MYHNAYREQLPLEGGYRRHTLHGTKAWVDDGLPLQERPPDYGDTFVILPRRWDRGRGHALLGKRGLDNSNMVAESKI